MFIYNILLNAIFVNSYYVKLMLPDRFIVFTVIVAIIIGVFPPFSPIVRKK